MLDTADSNRPERRSALVGHELSRLHIDIAALSEIRFPDEGSLKEHGAGYTLYWSAGQASPNRNDASKKLLKWPRYYSTVALLNLGHHHHGNQKDSGTSQWRQCSAWCCGHLRRRDDGTVSSRSDSAMVCRWRSIVCRVGHR
ncbi:hypothetical protein ACOMHN_033224 [Nucella lapillus]